MAWQSILKVLLIVHIIPVVISGGNGMEEKTETDNVYYMLTNDYCSMDEFEDLDYYLFCDTQIHKGVADFESKPSIICSETQNIGEAKELYQEFRKKLPLDSEEKDEEGEESNIVYVSPDCKWVITNKWSEHKAISTQMLFHKKEKAAEGGRNLVRM